MRTVTSRSAARAFRENFGKGQWSTYVDVLWFAAFLNEGLADYDRFWFIEYRRR